MDVRRPEVSVIILTYNQEAFVRQAIDSVIQQERDFDIEVLINDDCSSDMTGSIVLEYADRYPDIVKAYVATENVGAMKSYYSMLKKCKGRFIMGVSGDDYWLPGKMKIQHTYMQEHPDVGMCYGNVIRKYEDGTQKKQKGDTRGEQFEEILFCNPIPEVTHCQRKELNDIYMQAIHPDERDWMMEDYPAWLWYAKNSKISFIDEEFAVYRVMKGSISHPNQLSSKIKYVTSQRDVALFYADGKEEYISVIMRHYHHALANIYLLHGEIELFRKYNALTKGKVEKIKNLISFLPLGKHFLRKRLKG